VINLRYHIVSLVSVFLALAVGVLMGSTVLDRGTVALLERSSDQLRRNLDGYRAENELTKRELRQWHQYGDLVLPSQVGGQLRGRDVVLLDTDQVDGATRDAVREALRHAGATVSGRITFSAERLTLESAGDRTALGGLLRVDDRDATVLQRALVERLGSRLLTPATIPTGGGKAADDPLTALREAKVISELELTEPYADGIQAFPKLGSLLVILGPGSITTTPPPDRFLVPLAGRLAAGTGQPVVAVEPTGPVSWLSALRGNDLVSGRVSSVDDVDITPGQIALVQALSRGLAGQPPGHYGSKQGATKLLPGAPDP
jgi:hypothetical protein